MLNKFKKAMEAYGVFGKKFKPEFEIGTAFAEGLKTGLNVTPDMSAAKKQIHVGKAFNEKMADLGYGVEGDARYNQPKQAPKADEKLVEDTIEKTEIYKRAKESILKAQQKQVAYGLDKYPEPLNADTWSIIETIDHIIDESVDKLHYLTMLRIKYERIAERELEELHRNIILYADGEPYAVIGDAKSINYYRMKQGLEPLKEYDGGVDLTNMNFEDTPLEWSQMNGYAKADVEATQEFYEKTHEEEIKELEKQYRGGADMDGDYIHEYTTYVKDKRNFGVTIQPDHETGGQDVTIDIRINQADLVKHDDSVDALVYGIRHELDKMKNRGMI